MIHKNSLVDPGAVLGENVKIGPFSIIGKNVNTKVKKCNL